MIGVCACVCVCVCVCVCLCLSKHFENSRKIGRDGLKADIYATCRITFMFMSAVVLETAVSIIIFAPRAIRRILSCSSVCDCCSRVLRRIQIAAQRLL